MRSNAGRRTRLRAPRRRASRGAAVLVEWLQLHALVFLAPDVAQTRMCVSDQGRQGRFVVAAVFSSSAVHWRGKQAAGHCQTGEPQHHQPAIHRAHNPPLAQGAGAVNPEPAAATKAWTIDDALHCATCQQTTRIRIVTPPEASSRTTPVLRDFGGSLCQPAGSFTASSDAQSGAHPWLASHQLVDSARRMGQDVADGLTKRTTSLERIASASSSHPTDSGRVQSETPTSTRSTKTSHLVERECRSDPAQQSTWSGCTSSTAAVPAVCSSTSE